MKKVLALALLAVLAIPACCGRGKRCGEKRCSPCHQEKVCTKQEVPVKAYREITTCSTIGPIQWHCGKLNCKPACIPMDSGMEEVSAPTNMSTSRKIRRGSRRNRNTNTTYETKMVEVDDME